MTEPTQEPATSTETLVAEEVVAETPVAETPAAAAAEVAAEAGEAPVAPRPGVPVWRVGKPDAFLADAVVLAREALLSIAKDGAIGAHVGARSEGVRLVTHLFECNLAGYVGWQWFVTLTRVSRSKDATVDELGLLPTNDSVLAPPWVPWAERVRPEDAQEHAESVAEHELPADHPEDDSEV